MEQGQATPAAPAAAPQAPQSTDMRGVPDPVAMVERILRAEKEPTQAPAAPAAAPAEQVPAQEETTPEAEVPAAPNKQVEGDETPLADAQAGVEIPIDQLEAIEIEIPIKGEDGKDIVEKKSIKEAKLGYMRQADYQRKTAEVARQREAQAETVRQAIESERSAMQTNLSQLQDFVLASVAPELKNADWDKLAKDDPLEFVRLRNEADKITRTLTAIQGKQKELTAKQQTEQAAERQKLADKARETLQTDIPGWSDAHYQTLIKSADKHGFKPEEVATWVDPRAIKLLHKAHQFDQMQAEKKAPPSDKRVVVAPKVVKPGTPQQASQRQQKDANAMKQLRTSGRIEDAAAVIRSRLG